jgi:hypothetical protein
MNDLDIGSAVTFIGRRVGIMKSIDIAYDARVYFYRRRSEFLDRNKL